MYFLQLRVKYYSQGNLLHYLSSFMTDQDPTSNTQAPRPKSLVFLAILIFLFSIFQLSRFSQIILLWKTIVDLSISFAPGWLSIWSLLWGGFGLLVVYSLWTRKPWSPFLGMIFGIGFSIYHWINLMWFIESSILSARWPVNLVFTLIGLGTLIGILNLRSTRAYFGKNTVKIP